MVASLTTAGLGGYGSYAMQTSTSDTSYAGYGAYGQTGTASFTWQTQANAYDMRQRTSLQVQMAQQQRVIMPNTGIWSAWNTDGTSYTTDTVETVSYQQHVWGAWVEHDQNAYDQARYQLNEQGLEAVRQENARREAEYAQAARRYAVRDEARAVKAAEEAERKKAAEEVAQVLLGEIIGEEQLAVYKETGRLLVTGKEHDYLVHKSGGVQRVEKGKIVDLCVHVKERILLPPTDNVIGLAMFIKADEKDFNKVANASRPAPRPNELALAANY